MTTYDMKYRPFASQTETRLPGLVEWLVVAVPLLALLFAGCGEVSASRPADPEAARTALRDVLDSWQRGDAHAAPAARPNPIRVADEDWLAGTKLVSYKVDDRKADSPTDALLRCPVVLTLRNAQGRTVKKRVVYEVSTDPVASVIRHDAS